MASPRCAPCAASSASRGCRPSTEPISSASAGPAQRGSSTPCQVSAGVRVQLSRVISRDPDDGAESVATSIARGRSPPRSASTPKSPTVSTARRTCAPAVASDHSSRCSSRCSRRSRVVEQRLVEAHPACAPRPFGPGVASSSSSTGMPSSTGKRGRAEGAHQHVGAGRAAPRAAARGRRSGRRAVRAGRPTGPSLPPGQLGRGSLTQPSRGSPPGPRRAPRPSPARPGPRR